MMSVKILIVLILIVIIFVLFRGLFHMVKNQGNKNKVVKSLTWRISLSIGLVILLIIAASNGLIEPHGIQP